MSFLLSYFSDRRALCASLIGLATIFRSFAAEPSSLEKLEKYPTEELWTLGNSWMEKAEVDGEPILRWKLETGKNASLEMKPEHPLFARLRDYNHLEFEFRIVDGQVDHLELNALGHGLRRYKVYQWQLALMTTQLGVWHTRQLDLERPDWFPWDKPDGDDPYFRFEAVALAPDTVIELRRLRLAAAPLEIKPFFEYPITWPVRSDEPDGAATYTMRVPVLNVSGRPTTIQAAIASPHARFEVRVEPTSREVKNGEIADFTVTARISKANIDATPELYAEPVRIAFNTKSQPETISTFEMPVTRPLSAKITRQFVIPEAELKFVREKLGDSAVRKALNVDLILAAADKFLSIRLDHIPTAPLKGLVNYWPTVPGTNPPVRYEIGSFMPEIVNPVTGEREVGTPMADRVWKEYLGYSGQVTEKLGLAYALTGDEKYAAKAVELMEVWGRQYKELPLSSSDVPWNNGPALLSSSRIANNIGYAGSFAMRWQMRMLGLIAGSPALTPEVRKTIYEGFVLPYATECAKFRGSINNMSDIRSHNLLVMGLVFDDANLVRWALNSDAGTLSRLSDLDKDGFSSEGRPTNYHLAGMNEYLPAIGYLLNSGLKVDVPKDRLLAAIRMPYERATLWGVIPNAGDCGRGSRVGNSLQADQLVSIFPEENWLLEIGNGSTIMAKARALMNGRKPQAGEYRQFLETKPRLFREAGFAILRSGDTPETQIMATLDYGRSFNHGHHDRNQVTLAAFGKIFSHGTGSLYNAGSSGVTANNDPRLRSFCGSGSLGQNIVLVDEQEQAPAVGELLAWNDEPANQYAVARVNGIAPGVSHTRSLILRDGLVIILDRLESDTEHTYDFTYHNLGQLSLGPGWNASPVAKPLAETANYSNIVNLARLTGQGPVHLNWDLTGQVPNPAKAPQPLPPAKLALWQLPIERSEVFTGSTGMNNPNNAVVPDAAPSLFTRVRGKTATFVTVLEPYKEHPKVTAIEGDGEKLVIHQGEKRTEIHQKELVKNVR